MIECQYESHCVSSDDRIIFNNWCFSDPANPQYGALGRIQHRRKPIDSKVTKIGDRECGAAEFFGGELPRLRASTESFDGRCDLEQ